MPTEFTSHAKGKALKRILIDTNAASADPGLPAFISKPSGAPVYYGFQLLDETRTDGWTLGAITDFLDQAGCAFGDAFVEAPDGSRAGIVWEVGAFTTYEICPPTPDRWGVYAVAFPRPVRTITDLVDCFRAVLPELQRLHARVVQKT